MIEVEHNIVNSTQKSSGSQSADPVATNSLQSNQTEATLKRNGLKSPDKDKVIIIDETNGDTTVIELDSTEPNTSEAKIDQNQSTQSLQNSPADSTLISQDQSRLPNKEPNNKKLKVETENNTQNQVSKESNSQNSIIEPSNDKIVKTERKRIRKKKVSKEKASEAKNLQIARKTLLNDRLLKQKRYSDGTMLCDIDEIFRKIWMDEFRIMDKRLKKELKNFGRDSRDMELRMYDMMNLYW